MATGLQGPARMFLRILLWLAGAVIIGVLALLIIMEYNIEKNGGGEMVDGIALFLGLAIIAYYTIVLVLGRIMLHRGETSWGWFLVGLTSLLVVSPVLIVLFLASIGGAVA